MLLGACVLGKVGGIGKCVGLGVDRVVEATSWSKIRSIVCAVFLERSDIGVMWSQVVILCVVDGVPSSCGNIRPGVGQEANV